MQKLKMAMLASTAFVAALPPGMALAQAASPNQNANQLAEVVVTARKRNEDLLSVPVAVTALTATDLAARDIKSLSDVALYTPGLEDDQNSSGGARADRSFQQLIIRGLTPSSTTNPTTSVFINGVPVTAPDFLQNLDDVSRVEVLKGPQSAYFGRETFAGAVNVVPTTPGSRLTGDLYGEFGSLDTQKVSANLTVPIFGDKLSVRGGLFYDHHDGSYDNAANPSQNLGEQKTEGAHVAIAAKPIANLSIKAFGMVFRDNDGPAATGVLISNPGAFDQSNCTVSGTPFFCGTLPHLISSVSPAQNTTINTGVQNFFNYPGGAVKSSQAVKEFGLKRDAYHGDLDVDYTLPSLGLTLTYLGGFNRDNWSEVSDLSNVDGSAGGQYPGYTGFPFAVEQVTHDYSHEFRIATDQHKRFRALIGASYVNSYNQQALGYIAFLAPNTGIPPSGASVSQTSGVFFSLSYDILSQLTLTFEGRYQSDLEKALTTTGALQIEARSNDFLPRVSLQYKFTPTVMTYLTYSEGVNPGLFNTQILGIPAVSQTELATAGGGNIVVQPEKITNYELGAKGRFFHGRATVSADIYYDKWDNQLNLNNYTFSPTDPANPYNVVGGPQYVAGNTASDQIQFTNNTARSTAKGLEAEVNVIPITHLTLNLSGAINDTTYDSLLCPPGTCKPYAQSVNVAGEHLPFTPEYSMNLGAQYGRDFEFHGSKAWYVRGDYIYRSGVYIDPANTAETQDINLVNIRGGVSWTGISIEAYVDNLFNNKSYTNGFPNVNFAGGFTPTTVLVSLPQLINGGVRVRYKF